MEAVADNCVEAVKASKNDKALNLEVRCLMVLQFVRGYSSAVQRPQGFDVVVYSNYGIPPPNIGLVSMCGMFVINFGASACGFLADLVPANRRLWVYGTGFFLRTLFHVLTWPAMVWLTGGAQSMLVPGLVVLSMFWELSGILQQHSVRRVGGYNFGKVRLFGGVGFGLGLLITGAVASWVPSLCLSVVFLESVALCIINTTTIICMERTIQKQEGAVDKDAACKETAMELARRTLAFLTFSHVALFFWIVLVMGLCEGVMKAYTYLRIMLLPHGTSTVMGLSTVCMIVSEVPFYYYSGSLMKRFGLTKILGLALICMFLRQAWNAIVVDALLLLPGDFLLGITYSLANAAVVDHCHKIAPKGLGMTVQSLQTVFFAGLGQGGGALVGGLVIRAHGVVVLFAAPAYFAVL